MKRYTQNELNTRNKIIKSHVLFGNFLDRDIINRLINLFDENSNSNDKITKYIEDERKLRGLNDMNITIKSELYGETKSNSTLYLKIIKNNIDIVHLTLHLVPTTLNSSKDGIIHLYKNIYKPKITGSKRHKLYALILVTQPLNKPHSLEFSIASGYNTPPNIPNTIVLDSDIKKEMDVIITVLNRIFDENSKYYIGHKKDLETIHNKTNTVLNNINNHTALVTRKNKGNRMLPKLNTSMPAINISYKKSKNNRRLTRRK
jgi:hypothetical protein